MHPYIIPDFSRFVKSFFKIFEVYFIGKGRSFKKRLKNPYIYVKII